MKHRQLLIAIVATLALATLFTARSQSQDKPIESIMKAKLKHAQSVLEGLALEDFKNIETNAQALAALSRADAWHVYKTPEYVRQSAEFQRAADALVADAKAKKLEACTLDYVQLTMTCVNCHSHTRKVGVASAGPALDAIAAAR